MLFRTEKFDDVEIIENATRSGLKSEIKEYAKNHVIIDCQYSANGDKSWFSVLLFGLTINKEGISHS